MLYLIGLGLNNEKDISVAGLEIVKKCHTVYLEHYTAILMVDKEKLVCILSLSPPLPFNHPTNPPRRNPSTAAP